LTHCAAVFSSALCACMVQPCSPFQFSTKTHCQPCETTSEFLHLAATTVASKARLFQDPGIHTTSQQILFLQTELPIFCYELFVMLLINSEIICNVVNIRVFEVVSFLN